MSLENRQIKFKNKNLTLGRENSELANIISCQVTHHAYYAEYNSETSKSSLNIVYPH